MGNGDSENPHFSPDGRYVTFTSDSSNLSAVDGNVRFNDLFLKDLVSGETLMVDTANTDWASTGGGEFLNDDQIIYHRSHINYPDNGTYIYTISTGVAEKISDHSFTDVNISSDGRYITFLSEGVGIVEGVTVLGSRGGSFSDVYVMDMVTREIDVVSDPVLARQYSANENYLATGEYWRLYDFAAPEISADGQYLFYETISGDTVEEYSWMHGATSRDEQYDVIAMPNPIFCDATTDSAGNGTLSSSSGRDFIDGGQGVDTVIFSGASTDYSVRLTREGLVRVANGGDIDFLSNVEQLQFSDAAVSIMDALPAVQLETSVQHFAKVQAYFMGTLGREATTTEADQFTAVLQANQGRVWWNADQSAQMGTDSLMGYLINQSEYTLLNAGDSNATLVSETFERLTGETAPTEMVDHYVARLDAGTLQTRGVINKLLGELCLSPKSDGSLGGISNFMDNSEFLEVAAYRGYLDTLDAITGIDMANFDANGALVDLVGVTG